MIKEFRIGDGMQTDISTPEERKEIYELLQAKGYKVIAVEGKEPNYNKSLVLIPHTGWGFRHFYFVDRDYSYKVIKDLILSRDKPKFCLEIDTSPTIGLVPRSIRDQQRLVEVMQAISRYLEEYKKVPIEWFEEYAELVEKVKNIKTK